MEILSEFQKNSQETIRITKSHFRSLDLFQIRIWTQDPVNLEWKPTHKGISVSLEKVPDFKKAIDQALAKLEIEGQEENGGQ